MSVSWLALNQSEKLWADPAGTDAPEVDRELASQGHDGLFARGSGGEGAFAQEVAPFQDRAVLGLEADQPPGGLDLSARRRGSRCLVMQLWWRVFPLLYLGHKQV